MTNFLTLFLKVVSTTRGENGVTIRKVIRPKNSKNRRNNKDRKTIRRKKVVAGNQENVPNPAFGKPVLRQRTRNSYANSSLDVAEDQRSRDARCAVWNRDRCRFHIFDMDFFAFSSFQSFHRCAIQQRCLCYQLNWKWNLLHNVSLEAL